MSKLSSARNDSINESGIMSYSAFKLDFFDDLLSAVNINPIKTGLVLL